MIASPLLEVTPADAAWDELVTSAPGATVFNHPAWARAVGGTYGYPLAVLAAVGADGRPEAGLTLARVRRLAGAAWVSLPFSDHCPPLARDDAALRRLADGLGRWADGTPVEVRGAMPGWTGASAGWRHVVSLDTPLAELRGRLHDTHRRRLRQSERSGLRVGIGRTPEHVDAFYRLHVATRRRQGVPVQPRRFFASLLEHVIAPGLGVVALARTDAGTPVAGAVVLAWNGTAVGKFQASDAAAWDLHPNHLVYWAALEWAAANGCRTFDFGRSDPDHAGLQRWKAGWGATAVPLTYAFAGGARPASAGRGPLGAVVSQVIRRSPAPVCRALGALLYRYAA